MIIRLGRLTPGYFRLLQRNVTDGDSVILIISMKKEMMRQVSGEVRMQPQSSLIDPIAMVMATLGTGVSLYSTRRMAERVQLKLPNA